MAMGGRIFWGSDRAIRDPLEEAGVWPQQGTDIPPCPLDTSSARGAPFAAHEWSNEADQAQRTCRRCGLPLPRPKWAEPGPAPMPGVVVK